MIIYFLAKVEQGQEQDTTQKIRIDVDRCCRDVIVKLMLPPSVDSQFQSIHSGRCDNGHIFTLI